MKKWILLTTTLISFVSISASANKKIGLKDAKTKKTKAETIAKKAAIKAEAKRLKLQGLTTQDAIALIRVSETLEPMRELKEVILKKVEEGNKEKVSSSNVVTKDSLSIATGQLGFCVKNIVGEIGQHKGAVSLMNTLKRINNKEIQNEEANIIFQGIKEVHAGVKEGKDFKTSYEEAPTFSNKTARLQFEENCLK